MFSFDRFNLSRFSLGSQDNSLPIVLTLTEDLNQVAGVAIPIETNAFFNDIIRGSARGAIALKSSFEAASELLATVTMHADICITFSADEGLTAAALGSQNSNIFGLLAEDLGAKAFASMDILWSMTGLEAMAAAMNGVKNIKVSTLFYELLTALTEAGSQTTEQTTITVTLPPGSELRIDSGTFRVLLDGENVLDLQDGDWITLSRDLLYLDIESAAGNGLSGNLIYTERYL